MLMNCSSLSSILRAIRHLLCVFLLLSLAALFSSCASTSSPQVSKPGLRKSGNISEGNASWYSVRTNGGTATASGEKFTNNGHTAAHKTLPMGTMVEVTNLVNGSKKILRINDRGPFIAGRIIDIPIGIAKEMDFVGRGVVRVRVEVLEQNKSHASLSSAR